MIKFCKTWKILKQTNLTWYIPFCDAIKQYFVSIIFFYSSSNQFLKPLKWRRYLENLEEVVYKIISRATFTLELVWKLEFEALKSFALGFFPDDIELPTEDEDEMVRDVSESDHNFQHSELLGHEIHSRVRHFTLNYI